MSESGQTLEPASASKIGEAPHSPNTTLESVEETIPYVNPKRHTSPTAQSFTQVLDSNPDPNISFSSNVSDFQNTFCSPKLVSEETPISTYSSPTLFPPTQRTGQRICNDTPLFQNSPSTGNNVTASPPQIMDSPPKLSPYTQHSPHNFYSNVPHSLSPHEPIMISHRPGSVLATPDQWPALKPVFSRICKLAIKSITQQTHIIFLNVSLQSL